MTHQHFDFALDRSAMIDIYYSVRHHMSPLYLDRSFQRLGYHHDERTNPNWLDLDRTTNSYVGEIIDRLQISDIDHVISLSELPPGYALAPHRDVGRKSVLIIPLLGYEEPVFFQGHAVYYNDQYLLMDGTAEHWINPQSSIRVGIQISFKRRFERMKQHFENIIKKMA
jgi:hypothetical protein